MCPDTVNIKSQRGLGLPSALFLILIVILLLTVMNQLNQVNAIAYSREWLSLRSLHAAESGAQMAAVRILNTEENLGVCTLDFIPLFSFDTQGLQTCSAKVSCENQFVNGKNYYTILSEGRCGSGSDQAIRMIQVMVSQ